MRRPQCFYTALPTSLLLIVLFALASVNAAPGTIDPLERDLHDSDLNGIDDALQDRVSKLAESGFPTAPVRIIVTLYAPPKREELLLFRQLGGQIKHTYEHAVYGFAGPIPADRIAPLAEALGGSLCIIEADLPGRGTLDDAARQCRVRSIVWRNIDGYGLEGDADIAIAIMDTGVDTSHTDLSGQRLVFWHDFTTEGLAAATDRHGHGSHVAGIAAGTGAALGSGAISSLTTTMSGRLPDSTGWGFVDMIKVPVLGTGQVTSNLTWQGSGTAQINLATSAGVWFTGKTGSSPPLTETWTIGSPDIFKARAGNHSGLPSAPYSMLVTYPYTQVGDGYNLFRGMAPGCRLACTKMLYIDNTGWASEWEDAFDSLAVINQTYNIKVANASVGLDNGGTNLSLRAAVNGLASAGTVVIISAGNDYSDYKIPDPGRAERAITVGAINDFGAMTDYSCNGPAGTQKPDVVAPGGSHSWNSNVGSEITSIDTNVNDAYSTGFGDRQANDYANMFGTSMASPCVAGLCALMIQAQEDIAGSPWYYMESEVEEIKRIIQMTATETNKLGEESCGNNPSLDRGGKDRVEGYGKVNADAAIEAIIDWFQVPPDTFISITFGSGPFDRQCWASGIGVCGPDTIQLKLDVPATGDFDLYLYRMWIAGDDPQRTYWSTKTGQGTDELIKVPLGHVCETYYVVAKRVSGSGTATLYMEPIIDAGVAGGDQFPRAVMLGKSFPNPFSTKAAIPYAVPGPGMQPVRLKVYDARGALVRTLVESEVPAGVHRVFWDGKDDRERTVASGVYFLKLDVRGEIHTARLTLVK